MSSSVTHKTYSRATIRTNAIGPVDIAAASEDTDVITAADVCNDLDSPSSRRKNFQLFMEVAAENEAACDKKEVTLRKECIEVNIPKDHCSDSPQDITSVPALLSPVKWDGPASAGTCPAPVAPIEEMSQDKEIRVSQETVADMSIDKIDKLETPSDEINVIENAVLDPIDFNSEEFITSEAGISLIRSVVVGNMNDNAMEWSTKQWVHCLKYTLSITDAHPILRKVVKAIVVEEMTPIMSQANTQESDSYIPAPEMEFDSDVLLNNVEVEMDEGKGMDNVSRSNDISSIVNTLLSEESVLWSVKTWNENVAAKLGVSELSKEDKNTLKELIYAAASDLLTQTQDMDMENTDELAFLDELNTDYPEGLVVNDASAEASSSENDSLASSDSESYASHSKKTKSMKKNKTMKANSSDEKAVDVKKAVVNEELAAVKAIDEGPNLRAQAVHDLIYRDKDELEAKQAKLREMVLGRIRDTVKPHLQKVNTSAKESLKCMEMSNEKKSLLKDIVKVFVREDVLHVAEQVVNTSSVVADESGFINLSDDESSDDGESSDDNECDVENVQSVQQEKSDQTLALNAYGGLKMGIVKPLYGSRNQMKAELMSRAHHGSASRLASKVGVSSSKELVRVLGYAEAARYVSYKCSMCD